MNKIYTFAASLVASMLLFSCASSPFIAQTSNNVNIGNDAPAITAGGIEVSNADTIIKSKPSSVMNVESQKNKSIESPTLIGQLQKVDVDTEEAGLLIKDLPVPELDKDILNGTKTLPNDEYVRNEIRRFLTEFGENVVEIPEILYRKVIANIELFETDPRFRRFMAASLKRSEDYILYFKEVFAEHGLPEGLIGIPLVESGFQQRAISKKGAAGIFQFMPKTGIQYGLVINKDIDERYSPSKSAHAASNYIKSILAVFGTATYSSLLALSSYNCGEYRVINCLRGIDDYRTKRTLWDIENCLPLETREYVPRVLAASIIVRSPERFGFPKIHEKDIGQMPTFNGVHNTFNEKPLFTNNQKKVTTAQKKNEKTRKLQQISYVIKKGNTISSISDVFGVEEDAIIKLNKLKKNGKIVAGERLTIYSSKKFKVVNYKVKKKDTVVDIASRFNVPARSIIIVNGLKNGLLLKTNQTLTIYAPDIEKKMVKSPPKKIVNGTKKNLKETTKK